MDCKYLLLPFPISEPNSAGYASSSYEHSARAHMHLQLPRVHEEDSFVPGLEWHPVQIHHATAYPRYETDVFSFCDGVGQ